MSSARSAGARGSGQIRRHLAHRECYPAARRRPVDRRLRGRRLDPPRASANPGWTPSISPCDAATRPNAATSSSCSAGDRPRSRSASCSEGDVVDLCEHRRALVSVRWRACERRSRDEGRRSSQPRASIRSTSATIRRIGQADAARDVALRPALGQRHMSEQHHLARLQPERCEPLGPDPGRLAAQLRKEEGRARPAQSRRGDSLTSAKRSRASHAPLSARRRPRPWPG